MFRRILLSLALASLGAVHQAEPLRLSEPVVITPSHEVFGTPMPEQVSPFALATLLKDPEQYRSRMLAVETKVGKVCQKKGCFFVAQDGAAAVRVAFKDYGFFVPTDISGKTVVLWGELVARDLTPAQAEHFSKDAGATGAFQAGKVYELIASSVQIPR
ncbi:MAG: DUF4920 domain-containing protein [Pseudomonadota bacterium]